MRTTRLAFAVLAVPLLLMLNAQTAAAAPPSNDTFVGAIAVMSGFSQELDTSEATTDADDAQLNAMCGLPATDASVWYTFTNTSSDVAEVHVDVSASSYQAGFLVGGGTRGDLEAVSCGLSPSGRFFAAPGTTYYVLAIDPQFDGGGNGGTLNITVTAFPAPTVDITIDPVARFDRAGAATVSGTYTCTNAALFDLFGFVQQTVGRLTFSATFTFRVTGTCDGTTRSWSAVANPEDGNFRGGKATVGASGQACGVDFMRCAADDERLTVKLLRGGSN
jgi:hypothetical protein